MKDQQVGGSHYAEKAIDPFTFAMVNQWDPMMFSILKYLSRWQSKGTSVQDLKKASHIARYRRQFPRPEGGNIRKITIVEYCVKNGYTGATVTLLTALQATYDTMCYRTEDRAMMALGHLANAIDLRVTEEIGKQVDDHLQKFVAEPD